MASLGTAAAGSLGARLTPPAREAAGLARQALGYLARALLPAAEREALARTLLPPQAAAAAPAPAPAPAAAAAAAHHPLLGAACLSDVGSQKKVYVVPARRLAGPDSAVRVWEAADGGQRSFRPERAAAIAAHMRQQGRAGLPGVITLFEHADAGKKLSVLDGQHRLGALEVLGKQGRLGADAAVLVEVFHEAAGDSAAALFTEINQAQPIRGVDMPGAADGAAKRVLEEALQMLKRKYKQCFKPSANPRAPNVNIDALKDALFQAGVPATDGPKGPVPLFAWLEAQNAALRAWTDEEWRLKLRMRNGSKRHRAFLAALEKARAADFFLGLDASWLDHQEA